MKKALSAVAVLALFVSSCIRTYIPIPPPPHTGTTTPDSALSITGLSATTGAGGSNITIYGTGFSTTIAGSHLREGTKDGAGTVASFFQPGAVCVDVNGNLYVADTQNHLIRMITPDGTVSTIAGTGNPGDSDGIGTAASFNQPFGICINSQGVLFVADSWNNKIRQLIAQ